MSNNENQEKSSILSGIENIINYGSFVIDLIVGTGHMVYGIFTINNMINEEA